MSMLVSVTRRNLAPYIPLLAYVLFACFIALAGFQGFRKVENLIEAEKLHNLGAIADIKVGQIIAWQDGQRRRAEVFSGGAPLLAEFERWLQAPSDGQEQKLLRMLAGLQHIHAYKTVTLLDDKGVARISTGNGGVLEADDAKLVLQAMHSRYPVFSDIHRSGHGSQAASLSMAAPLVDNKVKNGHIVGAVLLQIDPYDFLYPLIQTWPGESLSAETLLTRQEGGDVLFINELRHWKGAALSLRIPVSASKNLPSVMAIHGESSTINGVDYRGVPVVAAMRRVPGTGWFMVSKVDRDEIFAPISQLKKWTAGLGLAFAVLGGFFFFVWLQGVQARHRQFKEQNDAALEREMLLRHFEYLTRYANDMIIVANGSGQIVEANERAQQSLGYSREEMLQKRIAELHGPLGSSPIPGELEMLKREGALRVEGNYQRKDGSTFPVEISARVIEVQGTRYLQCIVRDITERKAAEATLAQAKTILQLVLDTIPTRVFWKNQENRFLGCNRHFARDAGLQDPSQIVGKTDHDLCWSAQAHAYISDDRAVMQSRLPRVNYEEQQTSPDGKLIYLETSKIPLTDGEDNLIGVLGLYQDITERKVAERKIHRLNNLYAAISRANEAIVTIRNCDRLFHEICRLAVEYGQFKLAWIGMVDDATRTVKVAAFSGEASGYLDGIHIAIDADKPEGRGPIGKLLRDRRETICNDFLNEPGTLPWQENARKYGLLAAAACPLELEGRTVGALTLYADEVNYFDQDMVNLLSDLSRDISLALDNFSREEQRSQTEIMLQRSEERFRLLAENSTDMVFRVALPDGRYEYVSPASVRLFGYTPEEFYANPLLIKGIVHPARHAEFEVQWDKFVTGKILQSCEYQIIHKSGETRWMHQRNTPILDDGGSMIAIQGVVIDITERKRAEEELRESEARFRNMADTALALIWVSDSENLGIWFSKGWLEYTGRAMEQELGLGWAAGVHPDDLSWCVPYCKDAFMARKRFEVEFRLRRADGSYGWVADTGIPRFTSDGEFEGYIGYCWDITEHKQLEELRAKLEHAGRLNVAGEMASGMAHELSQPLTACANYLDACLRRMDENNWDREKLQMAVKLAHKQAVRAGKIINHLKDLVRKQGHERALIDINLLVKEVMGFLEDEIKRQGIYVTMTLFPLPKIMACRVEIEQVLINLYKNAIEAMYSYPQRELRVSTRTTESGDVMVVVSDTGRGLLPAEMESLFSPYQTSKQDGLGLGLPICRTFVENHGGRIWADAQRELGAEFYFTLPVGEGVHE